MTSPLLTVENVLLKDIEIEWRVVEQLRSGPLYKFEWQGHSGLINALENGQWGASFDDKVWTFELKSEEEAKAWIESQLREAVNHKIAEAVETLNKYAELIDLDSALL